MDTESLVVDAFAQLGIEAGLMDVHTELESTRVRIPVGATCH